MNKICVKCNIDKNEDHYRKFKSKNTKFYRRNICIKCEKKDRRLYFKKYYKEQSKTKFNRLSSIEKVMPKTLSFIISI